MYIQNDHYNVNMYGKNNPLDYWRRIKRQLFDSIPNKTIKGGTRAVDNWENIDTTLSNPAINRTIMGVTAIATQPVIDLQNKRVDKETREISAIRTVSKIIIGMLAGIAVRGSCHKLVESMTKLKGKKWYEKFLLPDKDRCYNMYIDRVLHKNYQSALSTSMAILVMCVTNFLVDAPLTVFLTNYLNDKRKEKTNSKAKEVIK